MTTIRDQIEGQFGVEADRAVALMQVRALGIDPDLPAEWATVDRCLMWLDQHVNWWEVNNAGGDRCLILHTTRKPVVHRAPTLHAALIAACKADQGA